MPNRRVDPTTVSARLVSELHEAAEAARHSGESTLAQTLDCRVEVLQWASRLRAETGSR